MSTPAATPKETFINFDAHATQHVDGAETELLIPVHDAGSGLPNVHSASSLVWGCRAWVGAKTSLGWSPQRETPQNCSQDLSGMWNGLKEAGLKQAGLGEARLGQANF